MKEFLLQFEHSEESKIICGEGALQTLKGMNGFLFTDDNVFAIYCDLFQEIFPHAPVYVMQAGEKNKTEKTLFTLLSSMAEAGLHRGDTLICAGGGVVGDIGALAAALYMRGINCIQVPTTLLSQVDSSVGGKTAIDFYGVKNLVGVIRQPNLTVVDPLFLNTLPKREVLCGLGEIVKHAALNKDLFNKLLYNHARLREIGFLKTLVPENIAIKAEIVKKDPTETGLRKCLNLGHTTGHAFELTENKRSHGEYVLIGLLYELEIAKRHLPCDIEYLDTLKSLIVFALGAITFPSLNQVAERALYDKKNNTSDSVVLTVPTRRGEYAILELSKEVYEQELKQVSVDIC